MNDMGEVEAGNHKESVAEQILRMATEEHESELRTFDIAKKGT